MNNLVKPNNQKLSQKLAQKFDIGQEQFVKAIKQTCFKGADATDEQLVSFLVVTNEYGLNPFTEEIYAFSSNGGIKPIVSVDGLLSITCIMYRKDREHPTKVTEYMSECKRNTDPWNQWPIRMLRHKATIQAARYAFGFSGIYEADEIERINDPVYANDAVVNSPANLLESELAEEAA